MSDQDLERRLQYWRRCSEAYAEAEGKRTKLDHYRRAHRAMLMKEYEQQGHSTSAAQEREAMADPRYLETLDALEAATEQAERLKHETMMAKMWAEAWRTERSDQRAERGAYGA